MFCNGSWVVYLEFNVLNLVFNFSNLESEEHVWLRGSISDPDRFSRSTMTRDDIFHKHTSSAFVKLLSLG